MLSLSLSLFRFTVPADRRLLVSTMDSDDLVVTSSLARWYLDHGVDVTVLSFVEYRGQRCFRRFADWVTEARRSGKEAGQLGATCKLIGNAAYGALLTDQTRFSKTLYLTDGEQGQAAICHPLFKKMDELSEGFFEVQLGKSCVAMSLPNQLGVTVLAHAKESLLSFFFVTSSRSSAVTRTPFIAASRPRTSTSWFGRSCATSTATPSTGSAATARRRRESAALAISRIAVARGTRRVTGRAPCSTRRSTTATGASRSTRRPR